MTSIKLALANRHKITNSYKENMHIGDGKSKTIYDLIRRPTKMIKKSPKLKNAQIFAPLPYLASKATIPYHVEQVGRAQM